MLVGCKTDGPAMLGRKFGFQANKKDVSPKSNFVHYVMRRFALRAFVLSSNLMSFLNNSTNLQL